MVIFALTAGKEKHSHTDYSGKQKDCYQGEKLEYGRLFVYDSGTAEAEDIYFIRELRGGAQGHPLKGIVRNLTGERERFLKRSS